MMAVAIVRLYISVFCGNSLFLYSSVTVEGLCVFELSSQRNRPVDTDSKCLHDVGEHVQKI